MSFCQVIFCGINQVESITSILSCMNWILLKISFPVASTEGVNELTLFHFERKRENEILF